VTKVEKSEPEPSSRQNAIPGTTRDQLEGLGRDVAELVRREAELAAASRGPQLRRVGVDILGAAAIALALLTAFALANAAVVLALATVVPAWAATLILAVAWLVVASAKAVFIARRGAREGGTAWWWRPGPGAGGSVDEMRAARDRARHAVHDDIAGLTPELSNRAIDAIVPIADEIAARMTPGVADELEHEAAGEVKTVGSELLEESEEIVESIAHEVPGASVMSQVWDVALLPGRTGVRMVTTVLRRPPPKH
jgi:hypothetical protein